MHPLKFFLPRPSAPRQFPHPYLFPSALEEARAFQLVHGSLTPSARSALSHSLAELDWRQVHTPPLLPARMSHLAQGWDHL